MTTKLAHLLPLICLLQSHPIAADEPRPSAAAQVDWEKVRATPAQLSVLNMEAVALVASTSKEGWLSVPERLAAHPAQIFKPTGPTNGVADYKVTADGYLLVACNYDYQGNSGGDWKDEAWTAEQFIANGWIEATEQELGGRLINSQNRVQRLFAKYVKAGESGRLRCNKYDPPSFVLCGSAR